MDSVVEMPKVTLFQGSGNYMFRHIVVFCFFVTAFPWLDLDPSVRIDTCSYFIFRHIQIDMIPCVAIVRNVHSGEGTGYDVHK
jgi:hypothetical protein